LFINEQLLRLTLLSKIFRFQTYKIKIVTAKLTWDQTTREYIFTYYYSTYIVIIFISFILNPDKGAMLNAKNV